jgi:transposase
MRLASLLRAGELVSVYVPTAKEEVFRDLVRAREDAKEDLNRHYQRLGKFLLRHQIVQPAKVNSGTTRYEVWLDSIRFEDKCLSVVFQEYRQTVREGQQRIKRYDLEIEQQAETGEYPLVTALQALRGVALLTAATLAVEIGNIARFSHPRQLMSYAGLVPCEHSSGTGRWQGRITKAGNAHLRRVVVEAAKSYRHVPGVRQALRKRLDGLSPALQELSWKAQVRLHQKAKGMLCRGKHSGTIAVAVARELLGFVWAVAQELEKERQVA